MYQLNQSCPVSAMFQMSCTQQSVGSAVLETKGLVRPEGERQQGQKSEPVFVTWNSETDSSPGVIFVCLFFHIFIVCFCFCFFLFHAYIAGIGDK